MSGYGHLHGQAWRIWIVGLRHYDLEARACDVDAQPLGSNRDCVLIVTAWPFSYWKIPKSFAGWPHSYPHFDCPAGPLHSDGFQSDTKIGTFAVSPLDRDAPSRYVYYIQNHSHRTVTTIGDGRELGGSAVD